MKKTVLLILLLCLGATLVLSSGCSAEENTSLSTTTQPSTTQPNPTVTTPADTLAEETPSSIKLMTLNLLYDTTSHPCMSTEIRGAHLMEVIQKYFPDSVSFNETTNGWMNYLTVEMGKLGYSYACGDRIFDPSEPLNLSSQYNPIFYQSSKYDLLETDTFWLSETPNIKGSTSWNSACIRTCTYAILKNKENGTLYAHFGTHLDHISENARQNGVLVIEAHIRTIYEKYGKIGIVLSGDFNDTNQSTTYKSILSFMEDSIALATNKSVVGATASGYSPELWENKYGNKTHPVISKESPIDYIFLGKNSASVSLYTVLNELFTFECDGRIWTNHPISDHYGVFCEATFSSPTTAINYDENQNLRYQTIIQKQKEPSYLSGISVINDRFTITSNLIQTQAVENLLKNDNSVAEMRVLGNRHGVWEITLSTNIITDIKCISFTTTESAQKLPQTLRVYVSLDGSNWIQTGKAYTTDLKPSTTYYIIPSSIIRSLQIKLVFSDCPRNVELMNLSIYGK